VPEYASHHTVYSISAHCLLFERRFNFADPDASSHFQSVHDDVCSFSSFLYFNCAFPLILFLVFCACDFQEDEEEDEEFHPAQVNDTWSNNFDLVRFFFALCAFILLFNVILFVRSHRACVEYRYIFTVSQRVDSDDEDDTRASALGSQPASKGSANPTDDDAESIVVFSASTGREAFHFGGGEEDESENVASTCIEIGDSNRADHFSDSTLSVGAQPNSQQP
jgi:hypothetical protein